MRVTQSVAAVHKAVRTSILDLAALAGVVLLLGMAAGAVVAQQIARPIRRLDRAARSVATGDLDSTVAVEGSTEQRSLARAFNEMTQRIKRLLRVQQDFVADASHQLRTPLTGLRLRLEGLGERLGGEGPDAEELEAAMREIDRLSLIVDELLILSRAGEHELPAERVDLGDAAARAAERWRRSAKERSIELEARDAGEPAHAWCATHDLDRSIDALLENALRYSPDRLGGDDRGRPRTRRDPRPRAGAGAGRGGGRLRPLQPGQRRAARARRHRPRAADRPRADPPVGRRGDAFRSGRRRDAGLDPSPPGRRRGGAAMTLPSLYRPLLKVEPMSQPTPTQRRA